MRKQIIRVGHSPDPDDAFMFHALANGKIDTGNYEFVHELVESASDLNGWEVIQLVAINNRHDVVAVGQKSGLTTFLILKRG